MLTTVFRVEKIDKPERGPYTSVAMQHCDPDHPSPQEDLLPGVPVHAVGNGVDWGAGYPKRCDREDCYRVHFLDIGLVFDEVCGMPTLEALGQWFRGYGRELSRPEHKLHVVELSIPEEFVRRGTKQLVLQRHYGTIIKSYIPKEVII